MIYVLHPAVPLNANKDVSYLYRARIMLTASENSNLLQIYNFRAVVGAHYTKLNVHSFFTIVAFGWNICHILYLYIALFLYIFPARLFAF